MYFFEWSSPVYRGHTRLNERKVLASRKVLLVVMSWATGAAMAGPGNPEEPAENGDRPLETVEKVDLERYMGRWYEIARYPNIFQSGVVAVQARYRLLDNGEIEVTNVGRKDGLDGPPTRSVNTAWLAREGDDTKWYVRFIWPFKAPYWIIDLGENYEFAVVGQPSRKYLWVLSRTPRMDPEVYRGICERLRKQGYDPTKLKQTPQPTAKSDGSGPQPGDSGDESDDG